MIGDIAPTSIARRTDPIESHLAAEEITADGSREQRKALAYRLLCQHPGLTANELENLAGFRDGEIRKRLNDLRHDGLARKGESRRSEITGKLNATWYPAG